MEHFQRVILVFSVTLSNKVTAEYWMNTEENWGEKKEKKWIFLVLDKSSNGENEQEQL